MLSNRGKKLDKIMSTVTTKQVTIADSFYNIFLQKGTLTIRASGKLTGISDNYVFEQIRIAHGADGTLPWDTVWHPLSAPRLSEQLNSARGSAAEISSQTIDEYVL